MMRRPGFVLFVFLIFTLPLLPSCNKELNIDNWAPDMLAPIIKSKITAREVCDLRNKKFTQDIDAIDLGFPSGVPLDIPALNIPFVGPYQIELSDYFSFVEVDSANLLITLQNAFPITISQGTDIVFRTSTSTADGSNVIFRHIMTADVPAGETYYFSTIFTSKKVTSDIFLFMENFKSPGGTGVTFSPQPSELSFEFKFLRVFTVAVRTNREHIEGDTSEVSFFDDISDYNDSTAVGTLRVFLTNGMPINFGFQMYFLDGTRQTVIDSIYSYDGISPQYNMYAPGGTTTNPGGEPIDSTSEKFEFILTAERIKKLKQSRYLAFQLKGDTHGYPGSEVYVGANSNLQLLITGDLKIRIINLF